jgi:hypothetical protein
MPYLCRMENKKPKPHDHFLKFLLDDTRKAKDFLRRMLPKRLVRRLDLESLTPENISFVSPALTNSLSDALFSVRLKGGDEQQTVLVSILLEHKSQPDKWTPVQLLAYLAEGYRRQVRNLRKKNKDGTKPPQILRPIIPFLFYQGGKKWDFPGMHGLFEDAHAPLLRHVPAFETIFTSLYDMQDEHIARIGQIWLRATLLTQKYSHKPKELLKRVAPIMRSIEAATDGNFFMAFTIYFTRSLKIKISDYQKLVDALPKDSNPQAMITLYDQLIAKGREEGLEQGLEKGLEQGLEKGIEQGLEKGSELAKREAVLSGMRHSVPIQVICVMTGYSEEKVMQIIREAGETA